jgi:hypothetical protein
MKVAISQSNYLPWAGFFGLIAKSDIFVFLDEVQFTSRDWRSRNTIKTDKGLQWLSIPVGDSLSRRICDVMLPEGDWKQSHKSSILAAYAGGRNFQAGEQFVELLYGKSPIKDLSEFNKHWIKYLSNEIFGLKCQFLDSRDIPHEGTGSNLILSICKSLNTNQYVTGPTAANYLIENDFASNGIEINYADYSKMKQYEQMHGGFVPNVSIIDMIFNVQTGYPNLLEIDTFRP